MKIRFLRTQQCAKSQCMMHNPVIIDGFLWLNIYVSAGDQVSPKHILESLILAQDERWRRA
ncbi:hypothetical protein, partial [Acrocarpospora corrugata]|uniref:hypothetical protein n=1 Tax=Acrocarpospora corrugata TaxID=35763 RepID=UPI0031DE4BA0